MEFVYNVVNSTTTETCLVPDTYFCSENQIVTETRLNYLDLLVILVNFGIALWILAIFAFKRKKI